MGPTEVAFIGKLVWTRTIAYMIGLSDLILDKFYMLNAVKGEKDVFFQVPV